MPFWDTLANVISLVINSCISATSVNGLTSFIGIMAF